jgi:hypothetical protein
MEADMSDMREKIPEDLQKVLEQQRRAPSLDGHFDRVNRMAIRLTSRAAPPLRSGPSA